MARVNQQLRDSGGRHLGWIRENGALLQLFNAKGDLQGWYNPRADATFNGNGQLYAKGNILVALLKN